MSRRRASSPWPAIGLDAWILGVEASTVMGLRMAKLAAGGPAAVVESQLMVQEKIQALGELQTLAMTGGLGFTSQKTARKSLAHYRRKVRANRRRLTRS